MTGGGGTDRRNSGGDAEEYGEGGGQGIEQQQCHI